MIIRENDPAVQELKRIVETQLSKPCTFVYANLNEANFGMDSVNTEDGKPVFVFVSNDKSKDRVGDGGGIIRTIPVVGLMLQMMENETIDTTSEEADPYINEMHDLFFNLIFNLNKSPRTNKDKLITDFEFQKVYHKFDKALFGGGTSFDWEFLTLKRGC